jgi:phosphoribosylaminoimidazole carboxylase PurE protein
MKNRIDVAIIIGSSSDLELINETTKVLEDFNLHYSLNIASAHRTAQYLRQCVKNAECSNVKVFIAAAGMAAALSGVIASETILPVIGIPIEAKSFFGLDSLFSTVQMPKGIPVATVAIGKAGAINAAILAAQIIAIGNSDLKEKLKIYKNKMIEDVIKLDLKLQRVGIDGYIGELKKNIFDDNPDIQKSCSCENKK